MFQVFVDPYNSICNDESVVWFVTCSAKRAYHQLRSSPFRFFLSCLKHTTISRLLRVWIRKLLKWKCIKCNILDWWWLPPSLIEIAKRMHLTLLRVCAVQVSEKHSQRHYNVQEFFHISTRCPRKLSEKIGEHQMKGSCAMYISRSSIKNKIETFIVVKTVA